MGLIYRFVRDGEQDKSFPQGIERISVRMEDVIGGVYATVNPEQARNYIEGLPVFRKIMDVQSTCGLMSFRDMEITPTELEVVFEDHMTLEEEGIITSEGYRRTDCTPGGSVALSQRQS